MDDHDLDRIPSPDGDFQGLFATMSADPVATQLQWWRQLGKIWVLPTPTGRWVFLADPDLVRQLLARHLDHGDLLRRTIPAQGEGITVQTGDDWKRSRELMAPMFTRGYLKGMVERMVEAIDERLDILEQRTVNGEVVNLAEFLGDITIRILFHAFFSDEYSNDEIDLAVKDLDQVGVYKAELQASAWAPEGAPIRSEATGRRAVGALDELMYASISRRRAKAEASDDILTRLVTAAGPDGEQFTDKEIRDQLTVLFFGGRETTQWASAWALSFIADHDEVRHRLLEEIRTTLGDGRPSAEHLDTLVYTKAVINEALRMQGNVMIPRQLETDAEFAGYTIPAGTQVCAATMALHRRPDLWDRPDDFDPTRFIEMTSSAQHAFQMLAFGGGPRLCLGMNLAYYEAQLIVAMLMQRFEFQTADGWTRRGVHQYSMQLAGGLPVTVRPRAALV